MFQKLVFMLVLIGPLGPLLFVEGQEFGGCRLCSRQVSYQVTVYRLLTGSWQTCTAGSWYQRIRRRCSYVTTYQSQSMLQTKFWTQTYCCPGDLFPHGPTADGATRLVDGAAPNEGRIEVNYKGAYGSVCADNFGTSEAATVCHQLGFAGLSRLAPCCKFGQTSGETWLDDVNCRTGEVWLANCTHRGWGVEDCHHGQDIGVVCNGALNIRLAGGSTGFEGRVEQYYAGSWGTVCDNDWDLNNAKVVCRQLGLGRALRATTGSFFGRGTGGTILSDVDCTGSETALGWCLHSGWNSRSCSQAAGVVCEGPKPYIDTLTQTTDSSIVVTSSVPSQLQFVNILTGWKVTLQRAGHAKTFVTTPFTVPNQQLTVNHLLPATRYTVWVSVRAGSVEGPLSEDLNVMTQEGAPGPVASVTGSPASATSVALSWAPPLATNGMLTSYHIDYESASGSGIHDNEEVNLPVTTASYTVTGLEEITLYHFTVSAETSAGRGEGSTVSVRTLPDAPEGAPRQLTANSTGPKTVALSWRAPHTNEHNGRLLSYTLEYSTTGSASTAQEISVPVDSSEGGDQQKVVEGLQPYTTYQFRVRAVNEVGVGPFSSPVIIATPEDVPGPVESFSASTVSSTVIQLSWTPPLSPNGRVIGYKLTYSATLPSGAVQNGSEFIRSPSAGVLTIRDLEENVLYQFTLRAETSAGEGEGRTVSTLTEEDMPSAAPQDVSVSASTPRSAVVRWRAPPLDDQNGLVVHYVVRHFPTNDISLVREEEVEAAKGQDDVIEHVVNQLQPFTTYGFVVAAATDAGRGPFSNPSSIKMPQDVPSKVRELRLRKAAGSSLTYTLTWEHPANPNGIIRLYKVYSNNSEVATLYPNQTSFTFTGLTPNTLYLMSVGAFTDVGEGEREEQMVQTDSSTEPPGEHPEVVQSHVSTTVWTAVTLLGIAIIILATLVLLVLSILVCVKKRCRPQGVNEVPEGQEVPINEMREDPPAVPPRQNRYPAVNGRDNREERKEPRYTTPNNIRAPLPMTHAQ